MVVGESRYILGGWWWAGIIYGTCVWNWVDRVYFEWVAVGPHFSWVSRVDWVWVDVYFVQVKVGGHFFCIISGGLWWMEVYFG